MDTYHWDVLVTYHRDVVGCFFWDLFDTLWRRLMGRCCYFLLRCRDNVPSKRHWVFHSRRTCDVTGTYRGTFLRCRYDALLPVWSLHCNVCLYVLIYIYHTILWSSSKRLHFWVAWCTFFHLYLRFDVIKDWCL